MEELMLKLNEFNRTQHLPRVKVLAKYITRGLPVLNKLQGEFRIVQGGDHLDHIIAIRLAAPAAF